MKKTRFFLLLTAAAVFLCTASSCGLSLDQNNIEKTFNEAAQKTDALPYIDISSEENYVMKADIPQGETNSTLASITTTDLQATMTDGEMTGFTAAASTSLYGFTLASNVYYKDGTLYTATMNEKAKLSNPTKDDLKPYRYVFKYLRYTNDMLARASMSETENGTEIAAVFAGNEFKQEMVDFLPENYFDPIKEEENYLDQLNFSDVTTNYLLKNGYISEFKISFVLNITIAGEKTSVDYRYTLKFLNPGSEKELSYPDNLDSYKELS